MAYYTAAQTSPAFGATQLAGRSVNDRIRMLFPGNAKLFNIVATGQVKGYNTTKGAGLISKRAVDQNRFECFTYSPLAITCVASTLSSTTLTVDSTSGFVAGMSIINTENNTCARIDSVTSATVLEVTSFGTTAFAVVGTTDVMLAAGTAYGENSSSPSISQKDEDNVYNLLQIMRYSWGISESMAGNTQLAGGNAWEQIKLRGVQEAMRKAEGSLLFSDRATGTGDTTSGGAVLTTSFRTTRGMGKWAANSLDALGSLTHQKFITDVPVALGDTINDSQRFIAFCGRQVYGRMTQWVNDKLVYMESGEKSEFGAVTQKFITSGPKIEVVQHDLFNRGAFATKMLIFAPENLTYVFKRNRDLKINEGIQLPSADGFQDELKGEIGLESVDAGNSMLLISNCY